MPSSSGIPRGSTGALRCRCRRCRTCCGRPSGSLASMRAPASTPREATPLPPRTTGRRSTCTWRSPRGSTATTAMNHGLEGVLGEDIRHFTAHEEQPFVLDVPVILIYVADLSRMHDSDDWDRERLPLGRLGRDGGECLPLLLVRRPGHRGPRQVRPAAARRRHGAPPDPAHHVLSTGGVSRMTAGYRISVDCGGTFTDGILLSDAHEVWAAKADSTPADPKVGVVECISRLAAQVGLHAAGASRRHQDHRARHHPGHQHRGHADGRQDGRHHHQGLPRPAVVPARGQVRPGRRPQGDGGRAVQLQERVSRGHWRRATWWPRSTSGWTSRARC